jgi:prepilin-type N-terminal cleavage/methylation domain-containing protein/prepilin-type processing-associated H-X9-DG protein
MSKKRGFTLIELLVVIAIIALLLSILIPALTKVKQVAQAVMCSSNTKQLTLAWMIYANANNDRMCYGNVLYDDTPPEQWVQRIAQSGDDGYVSSLEALDRELIGIRNGSLFPYSQDVKVYHCPSDPAYKEFRGMSILPGDERKRSPYRTFTIAGGMNGGTRPDNRTPYLPGNKILKKTLEIPTPANRYIFLEEAEKGKNVHNWGSWILNPDPTNDTWWDPISIWHGEKSVMGFADGHAETHKWQNKSTVELAEGIIGPGDVVDPSDDLRWMQQGYIPR